MVECSCGQLILAEVGEGWVLTSDGNRRWMRRRSDFFQCPACGARYSLPQILALAGHEAPERLNSLN
jgi:hypothetical protein